MDRKFEETFTSMFARYRYGIVDFRLPSNFERETVRLIRNEIAQSKLRPDGKLFLLLNFHLMVVAPMLEDGRLPSDREQFRADVLSDVNDIIDDVTRSQNLEGRDSRNRERPSAHAVMASVDRRWRTLRINKLRAWGGDDE